MDSFDFDIKGFVPTSLVDWPDRICSVIFLGGCSFRCPFCHNSRLVLQPESFPSIPMSSILEYLDCRRSWIDGVTVTGGEPTWTKNLPDLLSVFQHHGVSVKLDTNGSNPLLLERIIREGLVQAVYMDVKAPLQGDLYSKVVGVRVNPLIIRRSIQVLRKADLEVVFRTTVVPGLIAEPELEAIKKDLGEVQEFIVQRFRSENTLDSGFLQISEYSEDRFQAMKRCYEIRHRHAMTDGLWSVQRKADGDYCRGAAS
ncbi:MAG: pyruvate formate lyase activating enzyme [Thermodesulfobacteriota bacterium]|nr:pyruvate formate lyase activating enzyme [Thermodesulfobacteriota bacterium]